MEIGLRAREGRQAHGTPGDFSHTSRGRYRMFTVVRSPSLGQKTVWFPSQSLQGVRLTRMFLDCADSSVIRTSSRQELLYPRSKIAVVAKAFGLGAIDMVCDISL